MKILLSTFGTRGDVQPYVALSKGLQAAGHQVAVCTPEGFKGLVEAHGLTYAYVSNDFVALTEQTLQAQSLGAQMAASRRFPAVIRAALEDEWRAAQSHQPDLIVYHTKSLGSYHIAEKLGVPQVLTLPLPITPTRATYHADPGLSVSLLRRGASWRDVQPPHLQADGARLRHVGRHDQRLPCQDPGAAPA